MKTKTRCKNCERLRKLCRDMYVFGETDFETNNNRNKTIDDIEARIKKERIFTDETYEK